MEKIDIVLTTFNRLDHTKKMIQHLIERTKTPYNLIVVDNNSTDETQEFLIALQKIGVIKHLILFGENYGIHAAKNAGLALVRSTPYYIDTDNDLLCADLEPDWIEQLRILMDNHLDYGAIACRPQVLVGTGEQAFEQEGDVIQFDHVGAHLRIMRTDVVKRVTGWEKVWDAKRNHEDVYIARELEKEGCKVGYAKHVRCWHQFGKSWGYEGLKNEEHGHNDMWPPPEHYDTIIDQFNVKSWEKN